MVEKNGKNGKNHSDKKAVKEHKHFLLLLYTSSIAEGPWHGWLCVLIFDKEIMQ